tara:strand:+ start:28 stop:345 length:318 start_codon:yes stop_codon:yes gene_type:complete
MVHTAVSALNNYISNSLKTGNFSVLDCSKEPPHSLSQPNIQGIESKREIYTYTNSLQDNPNPVRNVFTNYGYQAENNTKNEYISQYGIAHFEPHSKATIGSDIIV